MAAAWLLAAAPAAHAATKAQLLAQGDRAMRAGKYAQACEAYGKAMQAGAALDRDFVRAQNLGLCHLRGQPKDAVKAAAWLETAWKLRPASSDTRFLLGHALAEAGETDPALEHYRALAEANPANPKYALAAADLLHALDRDDEAVATVEPYVTRNPKDTKMRMEYARLLGLAKRYDHAKREYRTVLEMEPTNTSAQIGIARVTAWAKDYPEAIRLYDEVLKKRPNNYDAQIGKAYALQWSGQKEEARTLFQALQQRNPGDKDVAAALEAIERSEARAREEAAAAALREERRRAYEEQLRIEAEQRAARAAAEESLRALITQARAASGRGDYEAAAAAYRQVLEREPGHVTARLGLARVFASERKYGEALEQYDEILRQSPDNLTARLEKARTLTYARNYESALPEFERLVKDAETAPKPDVTPERARLEYARALIGAKRYDEALTQLNQILPEGKTPTAEDTAVLVEKARAQAYAKRYDDALRNYDQALQVDPQDYEARMGKARTLYWTGRSSEAGAILRVLLSERPDDGDANYMMATIERGRGRNASALSLLDKVGDRGEAATMRSAIREDLRPVLRFRYGYGYERDNDEFDDPVAAILAHRFSTALEFSPHPNVRMTVSQGFNDSIGRSNLFDARFGPTALATETRVAAAFRATKWLRLTLGGGVGTTGGGETGGVEMPRRAHFLYEVRPSITHRGLRLSASFSRDIADYTVLAIHDNVVLQRQSVSGSYDFTRRLRLSANYWHGIYSVDQPALCAPAPCQADIAAQGGEIALTPTLYENDRVTVRLGYSYEMYGYNREDIQFLRDVSGIGSAGFFTPTVYQKHGAVPQVTWRPHPRVELDFEGFIGARRFCSFDALATDACPNGQPTVIPGLTPQPAQEWTLAGGIRGEARMTFGRFSPSFGYSFSSTGSGFLGPIGTGTYHTHYAFVALAIRF
ncbi:MAG TPA: tetratricopeptide repeat protein [Terriglobales bacterium]|nr:tetratricopeptide repeat protein [Terriglobales bacterium]